MRRGSPGADFGSLEKLNFELPGMENWETMCWQCDDWQAGETGAGRREGEAVAPAATCPASTSSQQHPPDPHLMLNLWHHLPPIRKMSQADKMAENLQNEQPASKYLDVTLLLIPHRTQPPTSPDAQTFWQHFWFNQKTFLELELSRFPLSYLIDCFIAKK